MSPSALSSSNTSSSAQDIAPAVFVSSSCYHFHTTGYFHIAPGLPFQLNKPGKRKARDSSMDLDDCSDSGKRQCNFSPAQLSSSSSSSSFLPPPPAAAAMPQAMMDVAMSAESAAAFAPVHGRSMPVPSYARMPTSCSTESSGKGASSWADNLVGWSHQQHQQPSHISHLHHTSAMDLGHSL
ncbi:hypothetical protein RI367_007334 [Sorochytrium milnesiophthora]